MFDYQMFNSDLGHPVHRVLRPINCRWLRSHFRLALWRRLVQTEWVKKTSTSKLSFLGMSGADSVSHNHQKNVKILARPGFWEYLVPTHWADAYLKGNRNKFTYIWFEDISRNEMEALPPSMLSKEYASILCWHNMPASYKGGFPLVTCQHIMLA